MQITPRHESGFIGKFIATHNYSNNDFSVVEHEKVTSLQSEVFFLTGLTALNLINSISAKSAKECCQSTVSLFDTHFKTMHCC